jgi:hypothetical protein
MLRLMGMILFKIIGTLRTPPSPALSSLPLSSYPYSCAFFGIRYEMDSIGNVLTRYDEIHGNAEKIQYTSLNQISQVTLNGYNIRSFEYDELGNMAVKSDVGVSLRKKSKRN